MLVLGLDPGPTQSAFVVWNGTLVIDHGYLPNLDMLAHLTLARQLGSAGHLPPFVVCEKIERMSSHVVVGDDTFMTAAWTGRFWQAAGDDNFAYLTRRAAKLHICGSSATKDADVRAALYNRFGGEKAAKGNKANKGPLFGITAHKLSALAVAMTYADQHDDTRRR